MIGQNIKRLRETAKMRVSELSRKSMVSKEAIYKIESGSVAEPGVSTISKIAEALNVSVNDLLAQNEAS